MTATAENGTRDLRIALVIPTYNNRSTLRRIVEQSLQTGLDVLVVNDGSTDGSMETIAGLPIARRELMPNRGKGVAIRAAAEWADQNRYTHLITLDADGQHEPAEALRFIEKIKQNPHSIVIGKRNFEGTATPGSSQFGRKFSNFWVKVSTGVSVPDSQSGFRAYPVEALRRIYCFSRRYNYEVEILVRGIWAGLEIQTVDITVHYNPQTIQASHFRPFVDNARISMTYTYLVSRNFFPWPHKVLFGERKKTTFKSFLTNPLRALKMLFTEKLAPREIVYAVMLGIFLGTLPLFAMHSVTIVFVATRLKLNRLIALNISHFTAPPFVPAMAIEVGYFLRHGRFLTEFNMQTLGHEALQRLGDYLIGSILLAPVLSLLAGLVTFVLIKGYRKLQTRLKRVKEVNGVA